MIIANIHEACTFLTELTKKEENFSNLEVDYSKFLISITPVIPHLSFECLNAIKVNKYIWPNIDKKFLVEENVNIVVQFNGKKRGIIQVKKDIKEKNLIKEISISKTFDKFLKDTKIKKYFYVKNRLINFLI